MTLRELRLWHWQQAMAARKASNDKRCSIHSHMAHCRKADFHVGCVQALNDVVMTKIGDTAERDAELYRAHRGLL